jgi:hypothetical protein
MKTKRKRWEHKCRCTDCRRHPDSVAAKEHRSINRLVAGLNEKSRRRFVGLLALQRGRGGVEHLSQITGLSRPTIRRGRTEVQRVERPTESDRVRKAGGGQPPVEKNIPACGACWMTWCAMPPPVIRSGD